MGSKMPPKTLAKTLRTIACVAPDEYGLYWDAGGTMPWKELYWALQEDPEMRHVRAAHLKEINLLGLDFPLAIDETLVRLKDPEDIPSYPPAEPPARLYYAIRNKVHFHVSRNGLQPSGQRALLALAVERDLALRVGRRRDPRPVLIEVLAEEAHAAGIEFRQAGRHLYLCPQVPKEYLLVPKLSEQDLEELQSARQARKAKNQKAKAAPTPPGSFFIRPGAFRPLAEDDEDRPGGKKAARSKKGKKGPEWKRDVRRERKKREL